MCYVLRVEEEQINVVGSKLYLCNMYRELNNNNNNNDIVDYIYI